jgi:hypothetical protein
MRINQWSEREDKILVEFYANASREELEKKLPRHPYSAIYARAFVLKLKRQVKNSSKNKGVRRSF